MGVNSWKTGTRLSWNQQDKLQKLILLPQICKSAVYACRTVDQKTNNNKFCAESPPSSDIMRCQITTHDSANACCLFRETDTKGVDISRHFSMYAFDGGTGNLRWKHEGEDFHKDAAELQDRTVPQHNHRLDAEHLGGRHYGEASCRDFRESVLAAMPHRFDTCLTNLVKSHAHCMFVDVASCCSLWSGCQLLRSVPR